MSGLHRVVACGVVVAVVVLAGCGSNDLIVGDWTGRSGPLADLRAHEVQVNQFTASSQENVSLDLTPRGNVIAAWHSRRQQEGQYGVYARLLNAAGEALSPEVQLNQHTQGSQTDPAVAAAPDGTAWFVWTSHGQDGDGGSIVARRFDERLNPISHEIGVNVTRQGHQFDPTVAVNDDGHALFVWTTTVQETDRTTILARKFDESGLPLTDEITIGSTEAGSDQLACAAATCRGGFVVVWARTVEMDAVVPRYDPKGVPCPDVNDGETHGTPLRECTVAQSVVAQRLDAGDAPQGPEILISGPGRGHIEPAVDVDDSGGFVIAWLTPAGPDYRVVARRFDRYGAPLASTQVISNEARGWVSGAAVAVRGDGSHLILWNQYSADDRELDIVGQYFDANGNAVGDRVILNRHRPGIQQLEIADNNRRIVWGRSGQLAAAWSGDAGAGDDSAAGVTLLTPPDLAIEAPDPIRLALADRNQPVAPIPPTFDPNWQPLPPSLQLGGDGPDFGFLGVNYTGWTPPDPEIAVGPDHLVVMTNGAIAFFDKSGTLLFQDEIESNFGFWGQQGATGFVFDPECLFDPHSQRFFAMACERGSDSRSYYLFAVSDDADPVGTWHKYRVRTPVDNDIDSPNMAVDENVLYLTADFFGPDKYGILMIEKAPLLSGGAVNSNEIVIIGQGEQSMGIPIVYDTNAPAAYLIQSSEGTNNGLNFNEVRFHAIQDPLGTPTRVTVDVNVPTYSYPNQPPQAGTSNRPFLFEPRFWSAMYVNGSLWATHHVNSSRARARWYEFEMNGWPDSGQNPTLRQSGEIDLGGQIHTFFPSIAADADGNAVIFYSRSSPQEFISIGRAFRTASDPLGEFGNVEFVKRSTVPYTGSGRWGDYSHVEPDQTHPGAFWGYHEWTDTSHSWRTWIAQVLTAGGGTVLVDVDLVEGEILDGDIDSLRQSDDNWLHTRSGFGDTVAELHLMEMIVNAVTTVDSPASMTITLENRIDEPSGTGRLGLFNWPANRFDQIGQFALGNQDSVEVFDGIDAANYVSGAGDIDVSMKHLVFVPFLAFTFESFVDHVEVGVE